LDEALDDDALEQLLVAATDVARAALHDEPLALGYTNLLDWTS
jgi:hypothetical protein